MGDDRAYIKRIVNSDTSKYMRIEHFDVDMYKCGLHAGDRLRLKKSLAIKECDGHRTGEVLVAGGVWIVLRGTREELGILWLQQPDGDLHTWSDDESIWEYFDRV